LKAVRMFTEFMGCAEFSSQSQYACIGVELHWATDAYLKSEKS